MDDIYKVISNHRSIRKYKKEDVNQKDLEKILDVVRHVPTSVNGQQLSVIVVKNHESKKILSQLSGNQKWIEEAPVFLVFVSDFSRVAKALEKKGVEFKNIESVESTLVGAVDCGIAFGAMMCLAEQMGYGIVPIGAVRKDPESVIKLLNLPKYVFPIVGMCIGVPDEDPALKPRFELATLVHSEKYKKITGNELEAYDEKMKSYMDKRTGGKDIRSWSDTVSSIYSNIYFPNVNFSMKNQGYTNEK